MEDIDLISLSSDEDSESSDKESLQINPLQNIIPNIQPFLLLTKAKCFFCSKSAQSISPSPQSYSLNKILQHLKINYKELINGLVVNSTSSMIPPFLANADLKVELCEECALSATALKNSLEQIEILQKEVKFQLKTIHSKITTEYPSNKCNNPVSPSNNETQESMDHFNSKIASTLREETAKRCHLELLKVWMNNDSSEDNCTTYRSESPQNKRRRMDLQEDNEISPDFDKHQSSPQLATTSSDIDADENSGFPEETSVTTTKYEKESSEEESSSESDDDDQGSPEAKILKLGGLTELRTAPVKLRIGGSLQQKRGKTKTATAGRDSSHSCTICNIKFTSKHGHDKHMDSKHYGIRYKCAGCDRLFTHSGSLHRHYKNFRKCRMIRDVSIPIGKEPEGEENGVKLPDDSVDHGDYDNDNTEDDGIEAEEQDDNTLQENSEIKEESCNFSYKDRKGKK